MMAITHAAIAVSAASLTFGLGTSNPVALGLALLGSQLPDLDTTTSTIGQILFPVSNWLEDNFPHRSITHSLLATVTLAAIRQSLALRDRVTHRLSLQSPRNCRCTSLWAFSSLFFRYIY